MDEDQQGIAQSNQVTLGTSLKQQTDQDANNRTAGGSSTPACLCQYYRVPNPCVIHTKKTTQTEPDHLDTSQFTTMENSRQEVPINLPPLPQTTREPDPQPHPQPIIPSTLKNIIQRHELDLALDSVSVARLKALQDAMTNARASTTQRATTNTPDRNQEMETQQTSSSPPGPQSTIHGTGNNNNMQMNGESQQTSSRASTPKNPPLEPETDSARQKHQQSPWMTY